MDTQNSIAIILVYCQFVTFDSGSHKRNHIVYSSGN